MSARDSGVKFGWSSLLIAVALMVGGCGREEPTPTKPVPAVTPEVNATIEQTPPELAAPSPSPSAVTDPVAQEQGRDVYAHYCADCHDVGEGHPGTMRLSARMDAAKSVLTTRSDLAPEYVKTIVRNGLGMMPAFRPTEIADAELDALAAYIVNAHGDTLGEAH